MTFNRLTRWLSPCMPAYVFAVLFFVPVFMAMSAQWYLSISRPIISIESTVLALLISLIYYRKIIFNILYIILYMPVSSAQLIEPISIRFGLRLSDSYYMLAGGVEALSNDVLSGLAVLFSLYLLFLYVINQQAIATRRIRTHWIVLFIAVLVLYDVLLSANRLNPKEIVIFPNILGAPILNSEFDRKQASIDLWDTPPRSYAVLSDAVIKGKNVLVVSFESLGIPIEGGEKNRIDRLIAYSFPGYVIKEISTEPFIGGTLAGELRVLCGIKTFGSLLNSPKSFISSFQGCLPRMAQNLNFYSSVVAAHANYSGLYRRLEIYPLIGFSNSFFASDLSVEDVDSCKSKQFAACDGPITRVLANHLNSLNGKTSFTYLMTIDSHFPYSSSITYRAVNSDLFEIYMTSLESTSIALRNFLNSLYFPPEIILISGDHSPPFIEESIRKKFNQRQVPVYVLERISNKLSNQKND